MAPTSILFQPCNHVGVGHVSRLLAIALAVRAREPELQVPFLVEGGAHGLVEAYGLPCLTLPHVDEMDAPAWHAWSGRERESIVRALAAAVLQELAPGLVVFDCFPHPAVLELVVRGAIPAVICLRKLKDMGRHFAVVRRHLSIVRAILIAHDEHECPVPDDLRSRTCFTGPIMRPVADLAPTFSELDTTFSERDRPRSIVISGGGGGFPGTVDFYNLALAALSRVRTEMPAIEAWLVTGPLFTGWRDLNFVNDVRVVPFDPHLSARFGAADLVVCQAGYNTITELRAIGVPSIAVPAERAGDDQFERSRQAASETLRMYDGRDPQTLAGLMLAALRRPMTTRPPARAFPGAARAAAAVLHAMHAVYEPAAADRSV